MHWEILTKNDILISEYDNSFLEDTRDIKICYFTDGNVFCGVKDNLNFFINNKVFDFKLKQKITSFFQFKTQKYSLFNNSQLIIYNVGINTVDDNYKYKYTMIIDDNAIKFKAEKFQEDKLIEHKLINLG
jgi:uncharacterized protein YaaW (UPF0174 family)